jgi:hypothetical protein
MVNMIGRFATLTTVIVAALSPALAWAQGYAYDPYMPAPYSLPPAATPYGVPPSGPDYGAAAFSPVPYNAPAFGPVDGAACDPSGPGGAVRYTQLPDDCGWGYGDTHLERFLKNSFRHAYFRLEWLNWSFSDPGNLTLGAPILDPTSVNNLYLNTSVPFDVFDPVTGNLIGQGVSPSLDGVKGIHNNGIRGTWGWAFDPVTVEGSIFALQTAKATVTPGDLPIIQQTDTLGNISNVGLFVVQGVLVNGVPTADGYLVYDQSYTASLQTSIWGTDGKILLNSYETGGPLSLQPFVGVRYMNFNERLTQRGVYLTPSLVTGTTPVERLIDADTKNYLYGPQAGFRAELPCTKWVTLGVQPSWMLGVNSYRATLRTQQIAGSADPSTYERIVKTTFGPIFDLQVYSNTHLTEHLSVFVAYNLMWTSFITRPGDNIVYNVTSTGTPSAFRQNITFSDLLIQGVSVGGEVRW